MIARVFISKWKEGEESKEMERQRERESVRVRALGNDPTLD